MNRIELTKSPEREPLAVSEAQAAQLIGVSARTLFNWRANGTGPRAIRVGGRILYAVDEIRRWLSAASEQPVQQADLMRTGGVQ